MLNRADDEVGLGADKVEAILGMPIAAQIPTSLDIAAATNAGTPIVIAQPEPPAQRGASASWPTTLAGEPVAPPR